MEKVEFIEIEAEVKKAVAKYKWVHLKSHYDDKNFGNWIIEFKNAEFRLRLVNDRGDTRAEAFDGTEWQLANHYFEQKNIETVSNYLYQHSKRANEDIFQFLSQLLMNLNALSATNFREELSKGRIPLFLEREEIEFLCNEWRKIPTDRLTDEQRKLWDNIAFKGQASLHKKGIDFRPVFPNESEKYQ